MPVTSSDLVVRLSGGSANTLASASLGGAMSSQPAPSSLFDSVSGAEAAAGDVEHRCVYIRNGSAADAANAYAWLAANTASASTDIAIGLGTSATNGTEQSVATEGTAPSGVTFSAAGSKGAGLNLGTIPAGGSRAVWIRRTVSTGAAAVGSDGATIRVECEAGA